MKELLSKDVLLSIKDEISLKNQTKRSKKAFLALPDFFRALFDTLAAAPYLVFAFLIIAGIDIQNRLITSVDYETALVTSLISLGLLTVANGLCYAEVYNTHTTGKRIKKPGWYVLRRAPRLVGVIILAMSITMLGLFMFILPGLYFAMRLSLATPSCIIEDLGIRESMKRSLKATKGQLTMIYTVYSVFGILFFPMMIFLIITDGILHYIGLFALMGLFPALIHLGIGILFMNSYEESKISFYR